MRVHLPGVEDDRGKVVVVHRVRVRLRLEAEAAVALRKYDGWHGIREELQNGREKFF